MYTLRKEAFEGVLRFLQSEGYDTSGLLTPEDLASLPEEAVAQAIARVLGLEYVDPLAHPPDPQAVAMAPRHLLRQGQALPHAFLPHRGGAVRVLVADPGNHKLLNAIRTNLQRAVVLAVSPPKLLRQAALRALALLDRNEEEPSLSPPEEPPPAPQEAAGGSLLLLRYLDLALAQEASDLHIEWLPEGKGGRVRLRVNGRLFIPRGEEPLSREEMVSLLNAVKVQAGLDLAQRLLPQDGRILYRSGSEAREFRVSIVPTVYGEEAVLRVMPRAGQAPRLEGLGLSSEALEGLRKVASLPYGMVLISGPTGSGKTTTLFALIGEILSSRSPKVLSVEDPVEYRLPGVSQVQVNPQVGLTFARALRAFLRQDPDVIVVGEIRDAETAKIAVEAAMTGHLVLGTVHTNTAPQVPLRLEEMGVERFKVADALRASLAQRLVPKLCPHCRVENPVETRILRERFRFTGKAYSRNPEGCPRCYHTGYVGRLPVFELFTVDDVLREMILKGATSQTLAQEARRRTGYTPMLEDGLKKVAAGLISLPDLLAATGEEEAHSPLGEGKEEEA